MGTINYRYIFHFQDDRQDVVDIRLDDQTLDLLEDIPEELPFWTRLDFNQCPNCQLTVQTHPNCPVAIHLVRIVTMCRGIISYDQIHVDIITPERVVYKGTTAQKGISSLMGLIMATSGCTHTTYFRPMARFHLPLASVEETVYRASSMYLLAQYFLRKQGEEADLELKGLTEIYQNIQLINIAMAKRLSAIVNKDAATNALVLLDIFAMSLPFAIEKSLEEIRHLFTPYLRKQA